MPRRGPAGFRRKLLVARFRANIRRGRILPVRRSKTIFRKNADLGENVLLAAPENVVNLGGYSTNNSVIFAKKSADAARAEAPEIEIHLRPKKSPEFD